MTNITYKTDQYHNVANWAYIPLVFFTGYFILKCMALTEYNDYAHFFKKGNRPGRLPEWGALLQGGGNQQFILGTENIVSASFA